MEKNLNTTQTNLTEKIKAIEDISDYMIYQENFRRFMETKPTPANMELIHRDQTAIEGFISFHIMSKRYIKSITLQGVGGNELQMGEPVKGMEKPWSDLAHASRGGIVWTDSYPLESGWTGGKRVVSMFRVINSFDKPSYSVGEVIVRLDESEITDLLTAAVPKDQGSIFIVRDDGGVLAASERGTGRPSVSGRGAAAGDRDLPFEQGVHPAGGRHALRYFQAAYEVDGLEYHRDGQGRDDCTENERGQSIAANSHSHHPGFRSGRFNRLRAGDYPADPRAEERNAPAEAGGLLRAGGGPDPRRGRRARPAVQQHGPDD
ncbi:cache domain-containing protein [Paenibacillus sp. P26]|nr:cache domain-containing protein [Paenibacillus sp. P26]